MFFKERASPYEKILGKNVRLLLKDIRVLCHLKARKFQSLLYKINTCLQKTTTSIGLRTEQIFSVNT